MTFIFCAFIFLSEVLEYFYKDANLIIILLHELHPF